MRYEAKVKHIDHRGKIIKQLDLDYVSYAKLQMMTAQHVIIETFYNQTNNFSIVQWDLKENQVIRCKWIGDKYNEVFLFSESQLICVIQRYCENNDILIESAKLITKISYFQFPLVVDNAKPIKVFMPEETECLKYQDEALKINNHSGIAWIKYNDFQSKISSSTCLTFYILDLRDKQKKIKPYRLENNFNMNEKLFSSGIFDIWEVKPGVLYIKCKVELSLVKFKKSKQPRERKRVQELMAQKSTH